MLTASGALNDVYTTTIVGYPYLGSDHFGQRRDNRCIGTSLFTLFKQVTDGKDATIQSLERQIQFDKEQNEREMALLKNSTSGELAGLQRELDSKQQELSEMYNFRQLLEEAVADLNNGEVSRETKLSLRKIEAQLASMQDDRKLLDSTKSVSKWVRYRSNDWLEQAVELAADKHPDLLSEGKESTL